MQCEAGKFHQNTEFCRVDFQPLKPDRGGPLLGRLLVTTFNNPWYYIVRFDVGDLARLDEQGECSCGRNSGFILSAIEGRVSNVTLTSKSRLVSLRELDESLSVLDGIDEYSLEQLTRSVYHLHLVSQRRDKDSLNKQAAAILEKLYGEDAEISVVYKDAIAPESSGKYSLAKTSFPLEITSYFISK
jgi:phenylacetate-coenzyme A ligase PaaK-like adenylate-forming protein